MFFKNIRDEIDSMMARDPAARSRLEVVLTYPGFHAILFHRLAHGAWGRGWRLLGRVLSHLGRFLTGIEIHPGARIGRRLFIDHGMGVVIGETSEIGDDVTLYHGVTLGGTTPSVDSEAQRERKRHPTLEDGVIVGSGAQVLGPITIGRGARVGANAVVIRDVAPGVTVTGIPARVLMARDKAKAQAFVAYGTPCEDLPDPVARAVDSLRTQLVALATRVEELEAELARRDAEARDEEDRPAVVGGGS
ncbi:MAG TPA: serine O-acetyltransferase [Alphaproteobacteria bacterium]|jgi:serine O-acetyltransferase|nr:serine O-acetyltransferase [Alphaproteobacteria bacterium]